WTVPILPYLDEAALYDDGIANVSLLNTSPVVTYLCPSRRNAQLYKGFAKSDYAGNGGRSSGTNDGVTVRTSVSSIGFAQIRDGLSNTMAVGESRLHRGFMHSAMGSCCSDNESAYTAGWADDNVRFGNFPPGPDV